MLIARIFLYLNIFITSSLIGYLYGGRYSKRVQGLTELQGAVRLLQTEIIVFANPLPYALSNISSKVSKNMSDVLISIKDDIEAKESGDIYTSFLMTIDSIRTKWLLKDQDIDLYLSLGKVIGKTDRNNQELQFKYVLDELELLIIDAKEEKIKNEKMYRSLGVLMGLGMIIILV